MPGCPHPSMSMGFSRSLICIMIFSILRLVGWYRVLLFPPCSGGCHRQVRRGVAQWKPQMLSGRVNTASRSQWRAFRFLACLFVFEGVAPAKLTTAQMRSGKPYRVGNTAHLESWTPCGDESSSFGGVDIFSELDIRLEPLVHSCFCVECLDFILHHFVLNIKLGPSETE